MMTVQKRIPIAQPALQGNELEYITACVQSNWISSQGAFVAAFEERFADYMKTPYALSVSNGTVALHLALTALGIAPGDAVLVPDLTFAATANAVIHCGATPVLVDVEPATWTINPKVIEAHITPRTKAIIAVHLYGQPANMQAIVRCAKAHNLFVVEDCAESIGAHAYGQKTGVIGDVGCFSFFANKIMTTGEGGMVTTSDPALHHRMAVLRDHGMEKGRRYWHVYPGFNYRLTNVQAAIGLAQMEQLDDFIRIRNEIAKAYQIGLFDVEGITLPFQPPWSVPVNWLYSVVIDPERSGVTRDELRAKLGERGIETRPFFHPLHRQPPYRVEGDGDAAFPVSSTLAENGLSLPTYVGLGHAEIDYICSQIRHIIQGG